MQIQEQMKLSNCGRDSVVYLSDGRFAEIVEIDGDKLWKLADMKFRGRDFVCHMETDLYSCILFTKKTARV